MSSELVATLVGLALLDSVNTSTLFLVMVVLLVARSPVGGRRKRDAAPRRVPAQHRPTADQLQARGDRVQLTVEIDEAARRTIAAS